MIRWFALLFAASCGTLGDVNEMVTLGPTFGNEHQGIVLALEVAPGVHSSYRPEPPVPSIAAADPTIASPADPSGPSNAIGIALTAAVGTDWHKGLGVSEFTAVGVDFLPWLLENGTAVGFGGQVAYARGAYDGFYVVAPRLWFATPVGELAGKPLSLGLMLRGQFGFASGTAGVGPSVVLRR